MFSFPELIVEQATLDWFTELGYTTLNARQIAPDEPNAERQTYSDVILTQRLENALQTINPNIPPDAIKDAIKKLTRIESPNLYENNRRFHKLLTDGVDPGLALLKPVASMDPVYFVLVLLKLRYLNNKKTDRKCVSC